MSDRERMIYDSITDSDLQTPVGELPPGKSQVLSHILAGPLGDELLERIAALGVTEDADG